jgi:hypothetical protein
VGAVHHIKTRRTQSEHNESLISPTADIGADIVFRASGQEETFQPPQIPAGYLLPCCSCGVADAPRSRQRQANFAVQDFLAPRAEQMAGMMIDFFKVLFILDGGKLAPVSNVAACGRCDLRFHTH